MHGMELVRCVYICINSFESHYEPVVDGFAATRKGPTLRSRGADMLLAWVSHYIVKCRIIGSPICEPLP